MLGGGSGHIFEMIARLKANEALRKKKSYFKTMQDYMHVTGGIKISIKEITKEELAAIRQKIKNNRKIEFRKTILVIVISILLLPLLMWLIIKGIVLVFI